MAASPPQVFHNVSPENYATLVEKANQAGIQLTGNAGKASQYGVEVEWNYSPEDRELSIQVLTAPFFMSADTINARIKKMVEETAA
jgi:hypothetical protein